MVLNMPLKLASMQRAEKHMRFCLCALYPQYAVRGFGEFNRPSPTITNPEEILSIIRLDYSPRIMAVQFNVGI